MTTGNGDNAMQCNGHDTDQNLNKALIQSQIQSQNLNSKISPFQTNQNPINNSQTNTYQLSERLRSEFSRDIPREHTSRSWNDIFKSYVRTLYFALIFGLFVGICTLSYQSNEDSDNSIIADIFRPIIKRVVKACKKVIAEPAFFLPLLIVVILACSIKVYYEVVIKKKTKESTENGGIGGHGGNSGFLNNAVGRSSAVIDGNSSGMNGISSPRHISICPQRHHICLTQSDKTRMPRPAPVIIEMKEDDFGSMEDKGYNDRSYNNRFDNRNFENRSFDDGNFGQRQLSIEESRWV